MAYISIDNVSINFGVVQALKNVSFEIEKGKVVALCGENGAGKSTLAKIIAGVYPYGTYQGKVVYKGKENKYTDTKKAELDGIGIVHQELNQFDNMTVAENIFMGTMPNKSGVINKKIMFEEAQKILDDFGIDINSREAMSNLSISKRQLVEIITAVNKNCEVIIFDEASSSLTESEVEFLFQLIRGLKQKGVTMIYVSHKLNEIFEICDNIVVLKDGEYINSSRVEDSTEKMLVSWMIGRELAQMFPKFEKSNNKKETVMKIEDWYVYQNKKEIIHNLSFCLRKGEILGFYGLVGAGRTELMQSLFCGREIKTTGKLYLKGIETKISNERDAISHNIGMLTEDRKVTGLVLTGNIKENAALASLSRYCNAVGVLNKLRLKEKVLEVTNRLKVKTPSLEQPVIKLSGGNQQKVVICKWLLSQPEILILDEPTRGIDVGTKMEIYFMLRELSQQGISIIFISSEMTELMGVCDRLYIMKEGSITGEIEREEFDEELLLRFAM